MNSLKLQRLSRDIANQRPAASQKTWTNPEISTWVADPPIETKVPTAPTQALALQRAPIPQHLMRMRGATTQPVGQKRGKVGQRTKKRGTWRDVTAGDAVEYGLKAWNLAKHLATLINVENKTFDVDGSGGTTITTTPLVVNLSNIAQGADYMNRTGDSILVQSIEWRSRIVGNTATGRNHARVIIVSDRLQRGVDPVLGDVLQGGTSPLVQPYLVPQTDRFDVLYDEYVVMNNTVGLSAAGTSTDWTGEQKILPQMVRKWNKHIKYQATTAADASNWINGLYLLAVSGDASSGPSLSYTFRINFTDN